MLPPDGEEEREVGPLRRCAVTRERGERARMLRFVVGPDGTLVPDLLARLPGRGIWLSARSDVVETARVRGAFPRAARMPVTVPADLLSILQVGLAGRVADLLGITRRAGQVVAGYAKAREWLQAGRVGLVLQAHDGSPDERVRLLSGARQIPVATPLSAARLGAVFGRDHVVHVAVAPGRLAEQLGVEAERLAGLLVPVEARMEKGGKARADRNGKAAPSDRGGNAAVAGEGHRAATDGTGGGTALDRMGGGAALGETGGDAATYETGGGAARNETGGDAATRRDGRAGMPAAAQDLPTGVPVARQSGRAGA